MPDLSKSTERKPEAGNAEAANGINIPVWLHATEAFYRKLNRVADSEA